MKKWLKRFDFWFDYYIGYFLTNGNKVDRYNEYMEKKWGKQDE